MKKFSSLGNNDTQDNKEESYVDSINRLLETLTLEIEGSDDDVTVDYSIKANEKFYESIKDIINQMYHKEKLELLEKAKINLYLNNSVQWIDEEINSIQESQKK